MSNDVSLKGLNQPGNLWINEQNRQLRYKIATDRPSEWVVPLSIYEVGNDGVDGTAYIRRGQPVSVGLFDDLSGPVQASADSAVVPTDPRTYQWCIGLALEPGNASNSDDINIFNKVHVLSHGQIEYDLNDTRPHVFQPPNDGTRYLWTYDDIGKPVFVSAHPDDSPDGRPGGLTIDVTRAYFDGSNIISVGRLADAPLAGDPLSQQQIVIEVQLSGDVRKKIGRAHV